MYQCIYIYMSSGSMNKADILAKLKIKNIPVSQNKVTVVFPSQQASQEKPINVKTKIVDKSKSSIFDRDSFLKKIADIKKESINELNLSPEVTEKIDKGDGVSKKVEEEKKSNPNPKTKAKKKIIIVEDEKVKPTDVETIDIISGNTTEVNPAVTSEDKEHEEEIIIKKPVKRRTKKPSEIIPQGPISMIKIGDIEIESRFEKKDPSVLISASAYYLNNREVFTNFITSLFGKYKQDILTDTEGASCDYDPDAPFSLMTHQKIVRDYINLYTPYRGILLFHGLGSGKTCSSIAIAEGMKSQKKVIVMTPASLRMNFIEELKKCGDGIYHKNQFWEFIDTNVEPELIDTLSVVLSISPEFIRKNGGAWLVNMKKKSNFDSLDSNERKSLNIQINEMIGNKYTFMNYNGMRKSHLNVLTNNGKKNPFDNTVIVIDEAHNFVSRIVNKLTKKEKTLSGELYEYLLSAQNVKIILLSGTPIINYPNEIAILFNILRGKIKTWSLKLSISSDQKVSQEFFKSMFKSTILGGNIMDFMEYKSTSTTLVITRNPFGFVNKTESDIYKGVRIGDRGEIDDDSFLQLVTKILIKNGIKVITGGVNIESYKALPDKIDDFKAYFINETSKGVKNMNLFKRRILGLTSYFRSAQESLMPKYNKSTDFHVIKIEMSDFQFGIYEEARIEERKLEKSNAQRQGKKSQNVEDDESVSTYRIFSRSFCNFVFPRPEVRRPMPKEGDLSSAISSKLDEDDLDALTNEEKLDNIDGRYEADDLLGDESTAQSKKKDKALYDRKIVEALKTLSDNKDKYFSPEALELYSPKFLNIIENVKDIDHKGLHLIYSQFRTLEGIGILKLVFDANNFVQFKIKKMGESWQLNMTQEELANPNKYALYTGTETSEEKEIIRNIFNGDWKYVPPAIESKIKQMGINNMYGGIIKALMISASGAEGISLKNVRYVHITEPYWHPVRIQQVIGRARRICSHKDLPEALRTVEVFLYLMTFSKKQLGSDNAIELRLKDTSKTDGVTPLTSDEALYEIATIKENINMDILEAVKESSIDCSLHSKVGSTEQLKCFTFGTVNPNKFSHYPSISEEEMDTSTDKNKTTIKWKAVVVPIEGINYAFNKETSEVFDLESYKLGNVVQIGKLVKIKGNPDQYKLERLAN